MCFQRRVENGIKISRAFCSHSWHYSDCFEIMAAAAVFAVNAGKSNAPTVVVDEQEPSRSPLTVGIGERASFGRLPSVLALSSSLSQREEALQRRLSNASRNDESLLAERATTTTPDVDEHDQRKSKKKKKRMKKQRKKKDMNDAVDVDDDSVKKRVRRQLTDSDIELADIAARLETDTRDKTLLAPLSVVFLLLMMLIL
jgi:hypothetical protein